MQLATLALPNNSNIPGLTYQNIPAPRVKRTPEIMNNIGLAELQDIPPELMQQLFTNQNRFWLPITNYLPN